MNDTVEERLARVETELRHATEELRRVIERLDRFDDHFVTRREYEELKRDISARRAPWYNIVGAVTGILSIVLIGVFSIINVFKG